MSSERLHCPGTLLRLQAVPGSTQEAWDVDPNAHEGEGLREEDLGGRERTAPPY